MDINKAAYVAIVAFISSRSKSTPHIHRKVAYLITTHTEVKN